MENKKKWYRTNQGIIILLVFFFPAGLFLMWKYAGWNKKVKWIITSMFAFVILISLIPSKPVKNSSPAKQTTISTTPTPTTAQNLSPQPTLQAKKEDNKNTQSNNSESTGTPKYDILFSTSTRYDGGKNYYILIDPINLSSNSFENDVIAIIKKIISEKGNKTSVEIYDNKDVLVLSYRQYGDMSLGRVLSKNELDQRAPHLIVSYDGDLETGQYLNTLSFFPGAFTDNQQVGKLVKTIEFDASK